jgi:hypothetical protein
MGAASLLFSCRPPPCPTIHHPDPSLFQRLHLAPVPSSLAQAILPFSDVLAALRCIVKAPPADESVICTKIALINYVQHALVSVKELTGIVRHEFHLYEREFTLLLAAEATTCCTMMGDAPALETGDAPPAPAAPAPRRGAGTGGGAGEAPPARSPTRRGGDGAAAVVAAARALVFQAILPVVTDIAGVCEMCGRAGAGVAWRGMLVCAHTWEACSMSTRCVCVWLVEDVRVGFWHPDVGCAACVPMFPRSLLLVLGHLSCVHTW